MILTSEQKALLQKIRESGATKEQLIQLTEFAKYIISKRNKRVKKQLKK